MRLFLAAALLALPTALRAAPISFDEALRLAEIRAPELRAREASVDAATSAAIAADRLPDPKLDLAIKDLPVTGPDAGRFNRDDFTMQVIGISQEFINPAKRRARALRAHADIDVAEAEQAVAAQDIRLATALAWIDLHYAKRRLKELDLLDGELDDLQATVSARLASGAARPAQALEPEQLRAQLADRRSALTADIARYRAQLTRFTGDTAADTTGDLPPLAVDGDALRAGLAALPLLRAYDARTLAADAETGLARADKRPDWTVNAAYGRREPNFGDLVTVGVTIDLPLFAKKRQDPRIAARASEATRARLDREAAEREVAAALSADLAMHRMHDEQLANARTRLVPLAKQRAQLDLESFGARRLDLGTALLSTLALAEAEVDALAREGEVARDAVRIIFTYGEARR
ncbi:transporter [Sphingopyxis bauzanensis]|uniref:TolC family protein n=2 Tax=Sphingopyxis TaxID=165697 RepID=A0A2S8B0U9_9SPHN|nr:MULTISPECIES: TolC family protein [Sphingopyxis]OWQ99293.1 transporter [Sphingopyxis bauzanensis]PQM25973.1 TolC family protein [Sphingopyxis lindanitolerans]GGJ56166.1 heavy metal RND transporter [Sphingopyxis bauzanensis]